MAVGSVPFSYLVWAKASLVSPSLHMAFETRALVFWNSRLFRAAVASVLAFSFVDFSCFLESLSITLNVLVLWGEVVAGYLICHIAESGFP